MPYQPQLAEAKAALEGKTVSLVELHPMADEGLKITFTDGTVWEFGWSGYEGECNFKR